MFIKESISFMLAWIMILNSSGSSWYMRYIPEEPKTEIVETLSKPVETPEVEEQEEVQAPEPIVQKPVDSTNLYLSESDINLIALVTMAEAEGEGELGQRLVIDVILNRMDSSRFPNTISGVIYARNAFECMWNGRVNRCYVRDDIRQLVIEEMQSRTNSNIHYFRTNHYHGFGKPVVQVGNHYFSTY